MRTLGLLLAAAVWLAAALGGAGCAAPKRVLRTPGEAEAAPGPAAPTPTPTPTPAPTPVPPAPSASQAGRAAAALAVRQIGTPYRVGGERPGGFDCSGLVLWVYGQQGVDLPRTVREQARAGQPVPADRLAPGDLLFFSLHGSPAPDHVGIMLGDNSFVHAPGRGRTVRRERIDPWWRPKLVEGRRP